MGSCLSISAVCQTLAHAVASLGIALVSRSLTWTISMHMHQEGLVMRSYEVVRRMLLAWG